jgi:hypothetical protein
MPLLRLLTILLILFSFPASAQKLISGSLKGLKGQKSYGIRFTYDSMIVGEDMPEERYLANKKNDWDSREPGKGDEFVRQWFDHRQSYYEPAFIRKFEEFSELKLKDTDAKYTLIVKTKYIEGGWNIGIGDHPGEVGGEMWIVESANLSHVIARVKFYGLRGNISIGGDFGMTRRIESAYETAGRWLGNFMRKKVR